MSQIEIETADGKKHMVDENAVYDEAAETLVGNVRKRRRERETVATREALQSDKPTPVVARLSKQPNTQFLGWETVYLILDGQNLLTPMDRGNAKRRPQRREYFRRETDQGPEILCCFDGGEPQCIGRTIAESCLRRLRK